jgi:hypothetical protein
MRRFAGFVPAYPLPYYSKTISPFISGALK